MILLTAFTRESIRLNEIYYFQDIIEGWKLSPITSMNICRNKDEQNILKNEKWMGIRYGCTCGGRLTRTCSRGCSTIRSIDPIDFIFWRNTPICGERDLGRYLELNIAENAENCPSGSRSCGVIDTQKNHLCMENSLNCPVNQFEIINRNANNTNINTNSDFKIPLKDADLFYANNLNNINDKIIPINFKISEDIPCRNPYYENIPREVYLLDYFAERRFCYPTVKDQKDSEDNEEINYDKYQIPNSNNSNPINNFSSNTNNKNLGDRDINNENGKNTNPYLQYDFNYKLLDTYSMEKLYVENNIYSKTSNLPYFPINYYNRNIYLSSKPFFGLKASCFQMIKNEKLSDSIYSDVDLFSEHLDDLNVLTISFSFSIVLSITYCLCNWLSYYVRGNPDDSKYTRCIITIPFALCLLVPVAIVYSKTEITINLDKIFLDPKCVDSFTIDLYTKFSSKLNYIKDLHIANMALSSLLIFSELVIAIYMFFNGSDL